MRNILNLFFIIIIAACNTTKSIYKSSRSKTDYLKIQYIHLTHCGCGQIHADLYQYGKQQSGVLYTDEGAYKSIYKYDNNGRLKETINLQAVKDTFSIPFDSTDVLIFRKIDSFAQKEPSAPAYRVKRPEQRGYVFKNRVHHQDYPTQQ